MCVCGVFIRCMVRYFKRITVPDVQGLRTRDLTWHWGNNTLVMYYRKPADLIANEQKQRYGSEESTCQARQPNLV